MKRKIISLIMISLLLSIGTTKQPTIVLAEENNIEQHTTSAQELEDYINFLESNRAFYTKESWNSTTLTGLIKQGKDSIENNYVNGFDSILNRLKEEYGKLIPELNPNIILGKNISAFWLDGNNNDVTNSRSPLSNAVDGVKGDVNKYAIFGNNNIDEPSYVQVDLGCSYPIKQVNLYRYWNDGRTYYDTALVISNDESFSNYQVLYYSSNDKDSNIFNLNTNPTNDLYVETISGYQIFSAGEDIPEARYIRLYGKGNNKNKENHIVELEVYSENNDPYKINELTNLLNSAKEHLNNTKDKHSKEAINKLEIEIQKFNDFISSINGNNKTMSDVSVAKVNLNNAIETYNKDIKLNFDYENILDNIGKADEGVINAINNNETVYVHFQILDNVNGDDPQGYFVQSVAKINELANSESLTINKYMDISIFAYRDESRNNYIGQINELTNNITISFEIPEEIRNAPEGMKRTFYIIHVHGSEDAEKIDNITINGNILTFKTNKFSVFALGYKDETLPPVIPVTPPSTSDNSSSSIIEDNKVSTVKKPIIILEDKKDEVIEETKVETIEETKEEVNEEDLNKDVVEKENTSANQKEETKKSKFNIIYLIIILCLLLLFIILILLKRRKKDNEE